MDELNRIKQVLEAALLERMPRLRAVFYGAGSIRPIASDALWERKIIVASAAALNAQPVVEFTLGAILLSFKRVWHHARLVPGLRSLRVAVLAPRRALPRPELRPGPVLRRRGSLVAGGQPDAPDPVPRGSLDEHAAAGTGQEVLQLLVLAELGHVPGDHHIEAVLGPALLIEPAHLPAQRLCRTRMRHGQDLPGSLGIAAQPRLGRHHVMLRRRVAHAVHGERRLPPLAQAALPHAAPGGGWCPQNIRYFGCPPTRMTLSS